MSSLSVGNRFTDWSASSFRKGVTFAIPPSKLIQLDIDPREIGKNYPVEVALVGDAGPGSMDLLAALGPGGGAAAYRSTPYFAEIDRLRRAWLEQVEIKSGSDATPMTMARAVREVQRATRDDAIVVTGAGSAAGHGQAALGDAPAADAPDIRRLLDDGIHACRPRSGRSSPSPIDRSSRYAATATSSRRCRSSRPRSSPGPRSASSSSTTPAGSASRAGSRRSSAARPGPTS